MKKIISLSILVITIILFMWLKYYGESSSYNYHVAYIVEYLFYWGIALFILSLFAFLLKRAKYKIWFLVTIPFIILSIFFAYNIDNHDILFNGQYVTLWFISLYSFISIIYFIVQFVKEKKYQK
jgi:succinate-acetate transporter protein